MTRTDETETAGDLAVDMREAQREADIARHTDTPEPKPESERRAPPRTKCQMWPKFDRGTWTA